MGRIIPFNGDRHGRTRELMPWYLTGRLDHAERAMVEAHLADCADCRAELLAERGLRRAVAELPLDVASGWAALRGRLAVPRPASGPIRGRAGVIGRAVAGSGRQGWMLAAQAAAILLVVSVLALPADRSASYHTLGSAPVAGDGNVLLLFRRTVNGPDLQRLLDAHRARLVEGPTAAGAYLVSVPAAERQSILVRLRARPDIALAEPVDASAGP